MAQAKKIALSITGVALLGAVYIIWDLADKKVEPSRVAANPQNVPKTTPASLDAPGETGVGESGAQQASREPVSEPAEQSLDDDLAIYGAEQVIANAMDKGPSAFFKSTDIKEVLADPDYNPQSKSLSEQDRAALASLAQQWDEEIANAKLHRKISLQQDIMGIVRSGDYRTFNPSDSEEMKAMNSLGHDFLKKEGSLGYSSCPGPTIGGHSRRFITHTAENSPNYALARKALSKLNASKDAAIRQFISQAH